MTISIYQLRNDNVIYKKPSANSNTHQTSCSMKIILVVAALVALCYGHVIPTLNDNVEASNVETNADDVEEQGRYVWVENAEGKPVLVNLDEPADEELLQSRDGRNNVYRLFTRRNRDNHHTLVINQDNTLTGSQFNGGRPINVIVHGWNNNENSPMNRQIREAFLDNADCNVIVVDWSRLANSNYITAVNGVPGVGEHLGDFLTWLIRVGRGNWNNVHLVGFSLGAHVVGNAGRRVNGQPRRITGLDPAGYRWHNNNRRLSSGNGRYVEAIHTDGDILGIMNPSGHADFYPNGGKHPQPGCWLRPSSCSHGRATELFASTVANNNLVGRLCPNVWEAELGTCNGSSFRMGNADLGKSGRGLYALRTNANWPF
nr:phospholipase A1 member A [Helicoverpa armigera]